MGDAMVAALVCALAGAACLLALGAPPPSGGRTQVR